MTGKEWNPEVQLYYFGSRWYDPEIGRWLSSDPIGQSGGINLYTYVSNNPIMLYDPEGYRPPAWSGYGPSPFQYYSGKNVKIAEGMNPFDFKKHVKGGGVWDYKKDHLGDQSWQNYGNYNYGVTGAATGWFTLQTLLQQAGMVQKPCKEFGNPKTSPSFGDDPVDQYWIMQGYYDYMDGMYGEPIAITEQNEKKMLITTFCTNIQIFFKY